MPDLYMQALLRGELVKKTGAASIGGLPPKDRFDIEIEREINDYVATLYLDEDPSLDKFNTPQMKRARTKEEMKEALRLPELFAHLEAGFALLREEGLKFLPTESYESMLHDFDEMAKLYATLDFAKAKDESFQKTLQISDETMKSIFSVAVEKFARSEFENSLDLFVLLTTLAPDDAEYWYRAGISAQASQKFELALKFYFAVLSLDPERIAPQLFIIDCYLKSNQKEEAKAACLIVEKIKDEKGLEESWENLLSLYKSVMTEAA